MSDRRAASARGRLVRNGVSFNGAGIALERLRHVAALSQLSESDLACVRDAATLRCAELGAEIATQRDGAGFWIATLDAQFRLTQSTPMARQVIMRIVSPGQHFGDSALLADCAPRDEIALAELAGDYLEIPAAAFRGLIDAIPAFARALLEEGARLAIEQADRIFELAALDLRHRLHAEILRLARHGAIEDDCIVIRPAPTHESFASLVGGTREGVTRELRTMASQGLVQVRRRELKLINVERLRAQLASKSGAR